MSAVPNLFGTMNWFQRRQFFHGPGGGGMVWGMTQAHYIYCELYFYYYYIVIYNEIIIQLIITLTGGRAQTVMRAMGRGCKYRWSFTCSPTTHLLLCGLVPNRPRTSTCLWPGSWGPLLYVITYMWNLKHKTNEWIQQNRNRFTDIENKLVVTR